MPTLRSDIVEVYVVRQFEGEWLHRADTTIELLQLHRVEKPLEGTWQPVLGHLRKGESSVAAAMREVKEELGLTEDDPSFRGLWQLEQIHPFFMAATDEIVMSPRFVIEVAPVFIPRLNHEHNTYRWIVSHQAMRYFMWPGQLAAVREIVEMIFRPGSITHGALRVK